MEEAPDPPRPLTRLVVPRSVFSRGLLEALGAPGRLLVGPTGATQGCGLRRLLVRRLDCLPPEALPQQLARFSQLALFGLTDRLPADPRQLLPTGLVSRHHTVAISLVGTGPQTGAFSAEVHSGGTVEPLDELEIAGETVLALHGSARAAPLPRIDAERWSRTLGALGEETWRRARGWSFALLGAGRSGSVVGHLLALVGAGARVVVIDGDVLERGNLDGVLGATARDIGRNKAEILAEQLRALRGDLAVEAVPFWAQSPRALAALRGAEVIVTTVDRDAARLAAAIVAAADLRIHLDVGTGIFGTGPSRRVGADVRLLLPGDGCVCCVGGLRDEGTARVELELTEPELAQRRTRINWRQERAGSLATVNAAAVGCALQLLLELAAGRATSSRWLRLEWDAEGRLASRDLPVQPGRICSVCGDPGRGDFLLGAR